MKKVLSIILVLVLFVSFAACAKPAENPAVDESIPEQATDDEGAAQAETDEVPLAGVVWYNFSDTFISNARSALANAVDANGAVKLIEADSQGDIPTQVSNIRNFYTQGIDYLIVNNINVNETGSMIEEAKAEGVTLLFVNCTSPTEEEFAIYDDVWHISSAAEQSGVIMGQIAQQYWEEHPEADRNGNGKLDYIMLLGLQDHYDTIVRASESIGTLEAAGIKTELVQEALCHYQRAEAQDAVASILQARQDDVEFIFACNDDMALGAIEALKSAGFFKDEASFIPVLGVDASAVGVEAIKEGTYLGTALNNPVKLGQLTYKLIELLAQGKEVTTEALGMDGVTVDGQHIWIDYVAITAENPDDASY